MSTKDRLLKFLAHIKISQGKFEKETGLSNGFVNNIGDTIRVNSLQKITDKYPQLNSAWLLTGEGEMIINPSAPFEADEPGLWEKAKIITLEKKLALALSMIYDLQGKHRNYQDLIDDIDNDTTATLSDLRKSKKKS